MAGHEETRGEDIDNLLYAGGLEASCISFFVELHLVFTPRLPS